MSQLTKFRDQHPATSRTIFDVLALLISHTPIDPLERAVILAELSGALVKPEPEAEDPAPDAAKK